MSDKSSVLTVRRQGGRVIAFIPTVRDLGAKILPDRNHLSVRRQIRSRLSEVNRLVPCKMDDFGENDRRKLNAVTRVYLGLPSLLGTL